MVYKRSLNKVFLKKGMAAIKQDCKPNKFLAYMVVVNQTPKLVTRKKIKEEERLAKGIKEETFLWRLIKPMMPAKMKLL